eukprot:gene55235-515_t
MAAALRALNIDRRSRRGRARAAGHGTVLLLTPLWLLRRGARTTEHAG